MTWLQDSGPNWTAIGTALAAILASVGVPVAAYNTWFKQKGETSRDANKMTLDGVFTLVDKLSKEIERKTEEIADIDERCNLRISSMEACIGLYEGTIARQVEMLASRDEEIRQLRLNQK